MKRQQLFFLLLCACFSVALAAAGQGAFQFTSTQRLTNRELLLKFTAPMGPYYRIDAATDLGTTNPSPWFPLVSLRGSNVNLQHIDSAGPFAPHRFYRAEQLTTGTNVLSGDHIVTTNGEIIIHPLYHASFVISWNGKIIYNDPDDDGQYAARYQGLPKADLILISHEHGDHYSVSQINAVRGSNAVIIVPAAVYNRGDFAALRSISKVLAYGATTNVMGIEITAVAGYNGNHPFGINNCYVLDIAGKRIFTSGDTGDTSQIRALTNIDVAFVCMNRQFTTNWIGATNMIRSMRPKIVYAYHYREGNGSQTNANLFKQNLGLDLGIEVRLRSWY